MTDFIDLKGRLFNPSHGIGYYISAAAMVTVVVVALMFLGLSLLACTLVPIVASLYAARSVTISAARLTIEQHQDARYSNKMLYEPFFKHVICLFVIPWAFMAWLLLYNQNYIVSHVLSENHFWVDAISSNENIKNYLSLHLKLLHKIDQSGRYHLLFATTVISAFLTTTILCLFSMPLIRAWRLRLNGDGSFAHQLFPAVCCLIFLCLLFYWGRTVYLYAGMAPGAEGSKIIDNGRFLRSMIGVSISPVAVTLFHVFCASISNILWRNKP